MSNEITKSTGQGGVEKTTGKKLDLASLNLQALAKSIGPLPRLFYQLVVFVLDGSGSMTWEGITGGMKGEEIHAQIIPVIKRLQDSRNSNSFDVSFWSFSSNCIEFIPLQPVEDIKCENENFNPCNYIGNFETYASSVLENVEKQVNNYLKKYKDKNAQVLILFLGDGAIKDIENAIKITDRLKLNQKVTISTYLFEDRNWSENLEETELLKLKNNMLSLSSSSRLNPLEFFNSTIDPEEIRKHMIKSISTVSKLD